MDRLRALIVAVAVGVEEYLTHESGAVLQELIPSEEFLKPSSLTGPIDVEEVPVEVVGEEVADDDE
jgi:hypothetical protein